ncbi:cellulose biosynthesis cyclic di-GMP-binding regulatory protein BcsB [Klebsiella pneumoniae]|nr:cellulose biosynthesis cyclic di-GMP-binding regulatory protein BcsB [Klebsiella pneumoniae]
MWSPSAPRPISICGMGRLIPLQVGYRFPSESWIDEDKSLLSVTLNGTFLNNPADEQAGAAGESLALPQGRCAPGALYHPAGALPDVWR